MPTVACLHHLEPPFLGAAEAPLRDAGLDLLECRVAGGDPLPDLGAVDGILSFGGGQSVVHLDAEPALRAEADLLAEAVQQEIPVLGLCLGGQLLARALGATVHRAPRRTVAWRELGRLDGGTDDALMAALPDRVWALHWNEDVFELPAGSVELLGPRSDGVEAFRAGRCAWGLQFHPELDPPTLDGFYADYAGWLTEAGVLEADARAADAARRAAQADLARRLFGAFARVVADARRVDEDPRRA